MDEFEQQILNIASIPTRWIIVKDDIRRSLMKRFPYVVYYGELEEAVWIIAIAHAKRQPDYWMTRKFS